MLSALATASSPVKGGLIEMDREVLWKGLFTLSERHHPKGDKSVRPILLMAMLRVHQMQN
jgi:hypothetical protein